MDRSFTMVVERDPDSQWLVGEIAELPGCHTQGPDFATLEANMREAISVYLATVEIEEPLPDFVGTWQVKIPA